VGVQKDGADWAAECERFIEMVWGAVIGGLVCGGCRLVSAVLAAGSFWCGCALWWLSGALWCLGAGRGLRKPKKEQGTIVRRCPAGGERDLV